MTRITPAVARVALPHLREFVNDDRSPDDPEWGALFQVQCELEDIIAGAEVDFAPIDAIVDKAYPPERRDRSADNEWNDGTFRRYRIKGIEVEIDRRGMIETSQYGTTGVYTDMLRRLVTDIVAEINRQLGWTP